MARPKAVWRATPKGRVKTDKHHMIIPVTLENEPEREVLVVVPISRAERFIISAMNAYSRH